MSRNLRSRSVSTLPVPSEDENMTQNANTSAADDSSQVTAEAATAAAAAAAMGNESQPDGCTHYVRRCALVVSNFE